MKAATQPASEITSNTRPRHRPNSIDTMMSVTAIQSSKATAASDGYYNVRMAADKDKPLTLSAALSASARELNGPTRTRVRSPSAVLATCT